MFQSPLRQAALLRKPSALPIRLAATSTVVEPATTASRPRQEATPAGCGPAAGPGTLISASVVSRSVISGPSGPSRTILPSPPGRHRTEQRHRPAGCHHGHGWGIALPVRPACQSARRRVRPVPRYLSPPGTACLGRRQYPNAWPARATDAAAVAGTAAGQALPLRPGLRLRRLERRRAPAGSRAVRMPVAITPAAAPPTVPAPPPPPPPPPTGGTSVGSPLGSGNGLWHRRPLLLLPLQSGCGWGLGLGSGGTRFHVVPKFGETAGHAWTGIELNSRMK